MIRGFDKVVFPEQSRAPLEGWTTAGTAPSMKGSINWITILTNCQSLEVLSHAVHPLFRSQLGPEIFKTSEIVFNSDTHLKNVIINELFLIIALIAIRF